MIQYLYQDGVDPCSKEPLKVRLDGEIVGEIRKVNNGLSSGYQYVPKGVKSKDGGHWFATVTDVQKSLEES